MAMSVRLPLRLTVQRETRLGAYISGTCPSHRPSASLGALRVSFADESVVCPVPMTTAIHVGQQRSRFCGHSRQDVLGPQSSVAPKALRRRRRVDKPSGGVSEATSKLSLPVRKCSSGLHDAVVVRNWPNEVPQNYLAKRAAADWDSFERFPASPSYLNRLLDSRFRSTRVCALRLLGAAPNVEATIGRSDAYQPNTSRVTVMQGINVDTCDAGH